MSRRRPVVFAAAVDDKVDASPSTTSGSALQGSSSVGGDASTEWEAEEAVGAAQRRSSKWVIDENEVCEWGVDGRARGGGFAGVCLIHSFWGGVEVGLIIHMLVRIANGEPIAADCELCVISTIVCTNFQQKAEAWNGHL